MRPFLVCGLLLGLTACASAAEVVAEPATRQSGRLRTPAILECDRNQLTSWSGRVSGYRRDGDQTWIEISTDEATVEATTLMHAGRPDASERFLLRNEPFAAGDMGQVEQSPGKLREGMRAVVWVCLDGTTPPVVDWQPPQA